MVEPDSTEDRTRSYTIMPEEFSGENMEDFQAWVDKYNIIATANGWNDETKQTNLPIYLTHYAFQTYMSLEDDEKVSYREAIAILKKKFFPTERKTMWRLQFRQMKRKNIETIDCYLFRLRKSGTLAYPNMTSEDRENFIIEQFILGSPRELKLHLLSVNDNLNLDEIVTIAKKFEAATTLAQRGGVNTIRENPNQQEITAIDNGEKHGNQRYTNKLQLKKGQICFRCNQYGHITRNCHIRSNKPLICFNCNKLGHIARNCRSREVHKEL